MDFFAEQPTERVAVSNQSAGNQRFCNYMYMYTYTHTYALCGYTSQPAAIAVNRTQGVKIAWVPLGSALVDNYLFSLCLTHIKNSSSLAG